MKVIDLLNKIANVEEVPKKIKFGNYEYEFHQVDKEYQRWFNGLNYGLGEDRRLDILLDDEVEIIEEEKKIPEKLENKIDKTFEDYNYSERMRLTEIVNKINEIIDYLKSKEIK